MEKYMRLVLALSAGIAASRLGDAHGREQAVRIVLAVPLGLVAIAPWNDQIGRS